jgi:ketosteroid isomerase-like protein
MRATRRRTICGALLLLVCLAAACGGGDGEVDDGLAPQDEMAAIESLIRANFAAVESRDFDTIFAQSTSEGLAENYPDVTDRTLDGYRAAFNEVAADRAGIRQPLQDVYDITVDGNTASATVETSLEYEGVDPTSQMIAAGRWPFRKIDGAWKIDAGFDWTSPRIPEGRQVVDIEATEFAFAVGDTEMRDGNVALRLHNAGEQVHQITVQRVPAELSIEAWSRGFAEPSSDIIEIGGSVPLEPGQSRNFTFTAPLPSGRYAMLCYIQDTADQILHAEKGMWAQFTVP